jgi:class 3 adenylate cyclase
MDVDDDRSTVTPDAWRERVYNFERRGMLYLAYDAALQGLDATTDGPDKDWLKHRAVLALARAGATEAAEEAFRVMGLAALIDTDSEVAALWARLLKEQAYLVAGSERSSLLSAAAAAYEAIHARQPDAYPAINAATLWLLADNASKAHDLAAQALRLTSGEPQTHPLAEYYRQATVAEAELVLGNIDAAARALQICADSASNDWSARASTRRQLRRVLAYRGESLALLEPLSAPPVIHYCGHMMSHDGRLRPANEPAVRAAIDVELDRIAPGIAYGALASGSDLLFAESLLARGVELTAVLPFSVEDFIRVSVAPAGESWVNRFNVCLNELESHGRVLLATEDDYVGDDNLFLYADEFSMGLTILRAGHVDGLAEQVTVWDGKRTDHVAGTYAAREIWAKTDYPQTNVDWTATEAMPQSVVEDENDNTLERRRCALLFGDFKGFSKLPDRLLPAYVEQVLGTVQSVVQNYNVAVRNTWGDAVYLVLEDVAEAADCALSMQRAVRAIDWDAIGFPAPLQLRLGGHYGPVYRAIDPILKTTTYVGAHVSRAARIEPVTPPGGVYVTEQFATKLALSHGDRFECDYVGVRDLPKNYGRLPLHLVREKHTG